MAKKIIHWTDPDYLDAFYRGWGSGQSVPVRQAASEGTSQPTKAPQDDDHRVATRQEASNPLLERSRE